jgi:hypothetical protein
VSNTETTELEAFLAAFREDWIKAGQPGPSLTIAMVKEIERLRARIEQSNEMRAWHPQGDAP